MCPHIVFGEPSERYSDQHPETPRLEFLNSGPHDNPGDLHCSDLQGGDVHWHGPSAYVLRGSAYYVGRDMSETHVNEHDIHAAMEAYLA